MEKFDYYHHPERHYTHGPQSGLTSRSLALAALTATVTLDRCDIHYATVDTI